MLTPRQRYDHDLMRDDFVADDSQARAVDTLNDLHQRLILKSHRRKETRLRSLLSSLMVPATIEVERGVYFWGGVGRGKTYLMDNFYACLPFDNKLRVHFHRFMRRVHAELKYFNGEVNPLGKVADLIAKETCIICFDEFFVSDITDAMILSLLMQGLFSRGVCLVATSNIRPDQLYRNGLQRQRFLPAIALIERHCEVINIDGGIDYRLRSLEQADLFYWPLGEDAADALEATFVHLTRLDQGVKTWVEVDIEDRAILALKKADGVVWFDFSALCEGPRSQNDYIEIAREFHSVLVSCVPKMGSINEDAARRFINLVDEFYDRGVKLVLSAEFPIDQLYGEGRLNFEFQRTQSRLLEMQSREYLARAHCP